MFCLNFKVQRISPLFSNIYHTCSKYRFCSEKNNNPFSPEFESDDSHKKFFTIQLRNKLKMNDLNDTEYEEEVSKLIKNLTNMEISVERILYDSSILVRVMSSICEKNNKEAASRIVKEFESKLIQLSKDKSQVQPDHNDALTEREINPICLQKAINIANIFNISLAHLSKDIEKALIKNLLYLNLNEKCCLIEAKDSGTIQMSEEFFNVLLKYVSEIIDQPAFYESNVNCKISFNLLKSKSIPESILKKYSLMLANYFLSSSVSYIEYKKMIQELFNITKNNKTISFQFIEPFLYENRSKLIDAARESDKLFFTIYFEVFINAKLKTTKSYTNEEKEFYDYFLVTFMSCGFSLNDFQISITVGFVYRNKWLENSNTILDLSRQYVESFMYCSTADIHEKIKYAMKLSRNFRFLINWLDKILQLLIVDIIQLSNEQNVEIIKRYWHFADLVEIFVLILNHLDYEISKNTLKLLNSIIENPNLSIDQELYVAFRIGDTSSTEVQQTN